MNRLLSLTVMFLLLVHVCAVAVENNLEEEKTALFNQQFNSLKEKYLLEMESQKDDGAMWLYYKGGEKNMEAFKPLIDTTLSIQKLWGVDEHGEKRPFTLLTEPNFVLKDGKTVKSNPFFFLSLRRLFESDRMKDSAFRDETIRHLIAMYDDEKYNVLHKGINGGMPYSFIIADALRRKWPADIQTDMKRRLMRRITKAKEDVNGQQPKREEIEHSRLRIYWLLDWTAEEKSQLVATLRPAAMRAEPLDLWKRYEWLALLILCDCGDKAATDFLYKYFKKLDYTTDNMDMLRTTLPFLTLVRRHEIVELLTMMMEREDILDKPRSYLWKNGSFAHTSAICLSVMLDGMPSIFEKFQETDDEDNEPSMDFSQEKRAEILAWLRKQDDYHFKPFNYFPEPMAEDKKDARSFFMLHQVSCGIFGYSVQIDNLKRFFSGPSAIHNFQPSR